MSNRDRHGKTELKRQVNTQDPETEADAGFYIYTAPTDLMGTPCTHASSHCALYQHNMLSVTRLFLNARVE